jgi:hypothetical protein
MTDNARSRTWFRVAAIYFVIAVTLGIAMGASGDHTLTPVHAHLNLLGWVSMSLFGMVAMAHPAIARGRAAACQFWLYNLGLPAMLLALTARIKGVEAAEPLVGVASIAVGLGVLLFAWLLITRMASRQCGE